MFEKVTQLVATALMAIRKRKKLVKVKPQHLTYFDNLKKKQQDQGSKNQCYIESFTSLTISNFRTTAVCFEYTKFLK